MLTTLLLLLGGVWTPVSDAHAPTPAGHVLLHVRLERPDGSPAPLGTMGRYLRRKVLVTDGRGELFQVNTDTASSRALGPGWDCYVVPEHSEVHFAATLPPFGFVEHVVEVGETSPDPIHLVLRDVPPPTLMVLGVADPAGAAVDLGTLFVRGPRTGLTIGDAYVVGGRCLVLLPAGDYDLQVRNVNHNSHDMGCGGTESWFHLPVPATVGGPVQTLHLNTEVAGRLRLRVVDPDRPGPAAGGQDASTIGRRGLLGRQNRARARLVATEREGISWNPRWCTGGRFSDLPTLELPLGVECIQAQPLPYGEYLLQVTGDSFEPVTVPVTLGPGEPVLVEVRIRS